MTPRLPRVLVIDDCAPLNRTIVRVLRDHDVTCVTNVRSALSLLVAQGVRYDAILCDLHMPEMNGADFLDALCVALPDEARRVLFMTGDLATTRLLERIPNECLQKPFSSDALRAAIARTMMDLTALAS
jgi:CheY-like chemotaxis protein